MNQGTPIETLEDDAVESMESDQIDLHWEAPAADTVRNSWQIRDGGAGASLVSPSSRSSCSRLP